MKSPLADKSVRLTLLLEHEELLRHHSLRGMSTDELADELYFILRDVRTVDVKHDPTRAVLLVKIKGQP